MVCEDIVVSCCCLVSFVIFHTDRQWAFICPIWIILLLIRSNELNLFIGQLLTADSSKSIFKFYHLSSLFLVGLTPVALINPLDSIYVSLPIDLLLGNDDKIIVKHMPLWSKRSKFSTNFCLLSDLYNRESDYNWLLVSLSNLRCSFPDPFSHCIELCHQWLCSQSKSQSSQSWLTRCDYRRRSRHS